MTSVEMISFPGEEERDNNITLSFSPPVSTSPPSVFQPLDERSLMNRLETQTQNILSVAYFTTCI